MLAVLFCMDCDSYLFLTSYSGLHSYCWTKSNYSHTDLYVCIIVIFPNVSFNFFFLLRLLHLSVFRSNRWENVCLKWQLYTHTHIYKPEISEYSVDMLSYLTLCSDQNLNQDFFTNILSELSWPLYFGAVRLGNHWTGHLLEKYWIISFTITVPHIVGRLGKPK